MILHEEVMELTSQMVQYRNNLSRKILENIESLDDKPLKIPRFCESFSAGWNEWKKNGEEKEETSFTIFTKYMDDEPLGNP